MLHNGTKNSLLNKRSFPHEVAGNRSIFELEMHKVDAIDVGFALYRLPNVNLVHVTRRLNFLGPISKFEGNFSLIQEKVPLGKVQEVLRDELVKSGFEKSYPHAAMEWVADMETIALAH